MTSRFPVLARLSTGTKMLLILSAALLPLGFIALLTSLDTAHVAQEQRNNAARMATEAYAAQVSNVIDAQIEAMRVPLAADRADYVCAALFRGPPELVAARPAIALFDGDGQRRCQTHGTPIVREQISAPQNEGVWLDSARRLIRIAAAKADRSLTAETEIPLDQIPLLVRDEKGLPLVTLTLRTVTGSGAVLVRRADTHQGRLVTLSAPVSGGKLMLDASYRPPQVGARNALLVALPLMMWLAAAVTGWFIVNRLILLPLTQLQRAIDRFSLGQGPLEIPRLSTPSHEIRELAESFATASAKILAHERDLEEGLVRQTKLTREVHHRVKNNLQVVSSLINLHARGATEAAATDAYAAIQRRVDALAVVHRNHYAEMEENRGVAFRALAGELASNLRASAPADAAGMPIALNMISANVTQDVAVPVAFLITEIVELMMFSNPHGSILISLEATAVPDRALLRIETLGLSRSLDDHPSIGRFERVTTGLARQLRSPLDQDRASGRFQIEISVLIDQA
jgi:two-component sensor histidine kinase